MLASSSTNEQRRGCLRDALATRLADGEWRCMGRHHYAHRVCGSSGCGDGEAATRQAIRGSRHRGAHSSLCCLLHADGLSVAHVGRAASSWWSAALAWAESFRRLSSQPSQKPRRFWRPGFSNSSSRSWARRRLHVGGLALPQVCLTCFPPHAAQPSLPPPGGLLVEDSNTDIVNCDNILRRYYSRYIDTAEKQIKNKKIKWRPSIGWVFTVPSPALDRFQTSKFKTLWRTKFAVLMARERGRIGSDAALDDMPKRMQAHSYDEMNEGPAR